jgi:carboxylesterase
MLLLTITTSVLAAALLWRALFARRVERAVAARLATGVDGVIAGAEPITLGPPRGRDAVLLLHGFGDTPRTLEYAAALLHERGYSVRVPLLPGHGRTLRAFADSQAEQWLAAARSALASMRERYERVSLVGLSMGGALSVLLAADDPELPALVLVAPYLDAPPLVRRLARWHRAVAIGAPYLSGTNPRSIHDDAERARSLAYGAMTPRSLAELTHLADRARAVLPRVVSPTLIIQSREDTRVAPSVAERAYERLGAREKRLVWMEGCGHIITVDRRRDEVLARMADWIDAHARPATQARGDARPA